jgi:hypothetical protein
MAVCKFLFDNDLVKRPAEQCRRARAKGSAPAGVG